MSRFIRNLAATILFVVTYMTVAWLPPVHAFQATDQNTLPRTDMYGDPLPSGALARIGTTRLKHVRVGEAALAFSPDGKTLACGGRANVRIWELPSGKLLKVVPNPSKPNPSGHPDWAPDAVQVKALRLSSQGRLLAFASNQKRALLYEPETGKVIHELPRDLNIPKAVSPDGNLVATVDSTLVGVELVDLNTGKALCKLGKKDFATHSAAFSPDGKLLATCDISGKSDFIRLWKIPGGQELRSLPVPEHTPSWITFMPDGNSLVAFLGPPLFRDQEPKAGDFSLVELDVVTGKEKRKIGPPGFLVSEIAVSADGKILAGIDGSNVRLLDINTGRFLGESRKPDGDIMAIAYQPDGKTILSAENDGTVGFWKASSGELQRIINQPKDFLRGTTFSADGSRLAFFDNRYEANIMDLATGRIRRSFEKIGGKRDRRRLILSAEGRILAEEAGDNSRLWDTVSGAELKHRDKTDYSAVAIEMKFAKFAGTLNNGKTITMRELATGAELWRANLSAKGNERVASLKFSPDGLSLASGHDDQSIQLWDVTTGKNRGWKVQHPSDLPKYSADGIRQMHHGEVYFAFSPDGRMIASAGYDATVRLWDTKTATELRCFTGHQGRIYALTFSPDGQTLASGGEDTSILVWDLASLPK